MKEEGQNGFEHRKTNVKFNGPIKKPKESSCMNKGCSGGSGNGKKRTQIEFLASCAILYTFLECCSFKLKYSIVTYHNLMITRWS